MSHSDHDTGSSSDMSGHMMVPYFHFTPGDSLFFKYWKPSSPGAIAGACIGLFMLGIFERFVMAMRALLDRHWNQRALLLLTLSKDYNRSSSALGQVSTAENHEACHEDEGAQVTANIAETNESRIPPLFPRLRLRMTPPLIFRYDIPRGMLHGLQSLLGFVLMLAAMTFRVEFILCIVCGLGVGEIIFGRIGNGVGHAGH